VELVNWFAHEIPRVYALLSEDEDAARVREKVEFIRSHGGGVTVRDIQRSGTKLFGETAEDIEAALEALVAKKLGVWESVAPGSQGGHPTRLFRLCETPQPDGTSENPEDFEVPSGNGNTSTHETGGRKFREGEIHNGGVGEPSTPEFAAEEGTQPDGTPKNPEDSEVVSGVGSGREPGDETQEEGEGNPDEEGTWTA